MTEKSVNTTDVDQTLRLVAALPAPEGLAGRVKAHLAKAEPVQEPVQSRLLAWPAPTPHWKRIAIAAGLLAAVAAGGIGAWQWSTPTPVARTVSSPVRPAQPQNFSTAGAMRTPVTLNGPAVLPAGKKSPGQATQAVKAQEPTGNGR